MAPSLTKNTLLEFIELWKKAECLWNRQSPLYSDKRRRRLAYEKLLEKVKQDEPEATIHDVKSKIKILRTSYCREQRKITCSKKKGAVTKDEYMPTVWYYNKLTFLSDCQQPQLSFSSTDFSKEEQDVDNIDDVGMDIISLPRASDELERKSDKEVDQRINENIPIKKEEDKKFAMKMRRKPHSDIDQKVSELLYEKITNRKVEDEFDIIGKSVAMKMRKMPPKDDDSALWVEGRINEVILQAHRGEIYPVMVATEMPVTIGYHQGARPSTGIRNFHTVPSSRILNQQIYRNNFL